MSFEKKLTTFFKERRGNLLTFLKYKGVSLERAEDIIQNTFESCWKYRGYKEEYTMAQYVGFRLKRQLYRSYKEQMRDGIFEPYADNVVMIEEGNDPEIHAMLTEQKEFVQRFLWTLPEKQYSSVVAVLEDKSAHSTSANFKWTTVKALKYFKKEDVIILDRRVSVKQIIPLGG